MQAEECWIPTKQGRLHASTWPGAAGTALPPIVLMHESLGCVALWKAFPARLAQATGHPVIAYDRLGFGQSDPYPGKLGLDFIREEARHGFAAVLARLAVEDFFVLGHSVGGGMAVGIGAAYPDRCLGVITEAAQAFVEDRTLAGVRAARHDMSNPAYIGRLARYHGDKARWVLDAWIETWLSPGFAGWSLDDELRRIHRPILAIHGSEDPYGSDRHPERIVALAGGPAAFESLPGCGHFPHREREAAVLAAVRGFVAAAAAR